MKTRKLFASIVAFLLVAMMPVVAFGANHEVSNWNDFKNVFDTDTDENVIINLLNDIFGNDGVVTTGENQKYTVNGGDFKLADVDFDGEGNVTVNATTGDIGYGGNVVAEQNGDVEGTLQAYDNATVTVNGDVNAAPEPIGSPGSGQTRSKNGVEADENAQVTVNGDIDASGVGVIAETDEDDENEAKVTVNGNVTGERAGVAAAADSEINVSGDVTSGNIGVYADGNAKVDVGGDVAAGQTGVEAYSESKVVVGGDVTGTDATADKPAGTGVVAMGEADVTVGGDVKGGDVPAASAEPSPSGYIDPSIPPAGDGVVMNNTATVKVAGNMQGGNNAAKGGQAGHGVRIWVAALEDGQTPGSLTVQGSVIGGANTGEDGKDGNSIYYDVMLVVPEITGATYAEVEGQAQQGYYSLMGSADATGMLTEEKLNAILGPDGVMSKAFDQRDAIVDGAQPEALSAAQISAIKDVYAQMLKDIYALLFPTGFVYEIPEITVSKLQAVNDAFFGAGAENMIEPRMLSNTSVQTNSPMTSQALAELLGAEVNYFVNVPAVANGKVTADKATAKAGETVTFTGVPDAGYKLQSIIVNGKALTMNADGTYSYVMETGGAEIAVAFVKVDAEEEKKEEDTTTKGGVPKTGDTNTLAVMATMCLAGVAIVLKKRNVREK